jgi:hypothetical protein
MTFSLLNSTSKYRSGVVVVSQRQIDLVGRATSRVGTTGRTGPMAATR